MVKNSRLVFTVMKVVSWIIFVGLCIEAGGLLVNLVFHVVNPDVIPSLYQTLDLSDVYVNNVWVFAGVYSFVLSIALLKVYLFFVVVMLLSKMDLSRPFSEYVSRQVLMVSYVTACIGMFTLVGRNVTHSVVQFGNSLAGVESFWEDSGAYLLMAAVVYIIASIIDYGVTMQNEQDLTV